MKRTNFSLRFLIIGSFYLFALARYTKAEDWPAGYQVYDNTQSPDERFAILVPTADAAEADEKLREINYFADLKNHRLLGKIAGADYFAGQNHRGLKAIWADDSSWCVVQYDDRFGFASIFILEPKGSSFAQIEIGTKIGKLLGGTISKKPHGDDENGGDAETYFRFGDDGKLSARALSTTDPKQFDTKHAHFGFFSGTFDVRAKKWQNAQAKPVDWEGFNNGESALDDSLTDPEGHTFQSDKDKSSWLDEQMNAVYNFARVVLPPNRFAKVKNEQRDWLKKRDAASSVAEKCKLMTERIQALQDLIW